MLSYPHTHTLLGLFEFVHVVLFPLRQCIIVVALVPITPSTHYICTKGNLLLLYCRIKGLQPQIIYRQSDMLLLYYASVTLNMSY